MKLILIDGGPASGKNTLGTLLVEKLKTTGENVILLDLDSYVERINPSWIWSNKDQERQDQLKARENFAKKSGVKYTTLTKIENNVIKKPSVLIMAKLAK